LLEGESGSTVGPYLRQELLGEGGMGVVYRAVHRDTGRIVALKTVRQVEKPDLREALRREIRALSSLHHDGVVSILDSGVEKLTPWFAMEYLERRTVDDFHAALWGNRPERGEVTTLVAMPDGRQPGEPPRSARGAGPPRAAAGGRLPEVLALIQRISEALGYVHGEGLVHRDLKPENVFLRPDGRPVLVDFGLTAWFGGTGSERLEAGKRRAGTAAFMAPEVLRGEPMDARADLYSLGCLFYLLVTGELPFVGASAQDVAKMHQEREPVPPGALVAGLPPSIDALIMGLLAKAPEERTGHAQDVIDGLAPLLPGTAVEADGRSKRFYLYRPRLAGRDELRAELDVHVARLKAGAGGLVFLGGESGAGKTFLANDLATRAERLGVKVLTGECEPLGASGGPGLRDERSVSLHPFRQFLAAVADRCVQAGEAAERRPLAAHAAALARYHRPFAELAPPPPAGAVAELEGEEVRSGGIAAMASTLAAFAAQQPLLLILDDLQWADALSLDLLRYLTAEFLAAHALLLVCTYRPEEVGADLASLLARADARRLALERLGHEAVARQVQDMLALAAAPAALVTFLHENSEGVPFFIAEYLRAAMEKEILHRHAGRWVVSTTGESLDKLGSALDLPRSLHDLVAARLRRLSPQGGAMAAAAAVLGRELDADMLDEAAAQTPDQFVAGLTELVRLQILEQRAPGRYRFVHDKLREIAYQQTDAATRRRLHARVAEVLERHGENPDAYPALARHFRNAGETTKAAHYSRLAGRQAWMKGAFQDAREHLTRALELAPSRDAGEATLGERLSEAQTRHWLASALFCSGDIDDAIERFRESLAWLRRGRLPRTPAGWARFIAALAVQQLWQRWLPSALYESRPGLRRDLIAEAAQVSVRLSWSFAFRYRMREMLASVLLGANLSDRASALGPRATAHAALGCFLGHLGLRRVAARYFDRARQNAQASGDAMAVVREAQSECVFYLNQGRWDELRACGEPALAHGLAIGATHETEALAQALGSAATLTGELASAEQQARALGETAARLGHRIQSWWGSLTMASVLFRRGRFAEVEALLAPVEQGCRESSDVVSQLECLAFMAATAARRGDGELALKLAARARETAASHGSGSLFGYSFHWLLPEIYAAEAARPSRAPAERRRLLTWFDESQRAAARFSRMCRVARPFALAQRGRSFELRGRPAAAAAAFRQSGREAAALRMPFDRALAELDLARLPTLPPADRERHAARGREILDGLGCGGYVGGGA
jgi:serine/threonine protein kinase/tetratricopeptide (TPR) repeat protein